MTIAENLYEFAFCHANKFDYLAKLADPEPWGDDNKRLISYMSHLYMRIAQVYNECERIGAPCNNIVFENDMCCFDTGLFTSRYESIYALFVPNMRPEATQKWFLDGFYKASDRTLDFDDLPERMHFYDNPADLVYDYRYEIRVNIDHILGDEENMSRVPAFFREPGREMLLRRTLEGAIKEAERRASANYMLAVPQYYRGTIQLLLPLCLTGEVPELALTIQREDGYYSARTCLTTEMAYNNARLIARPEASWIVQAGE